MATMQLLDESGQAELKQSSGSGQALPVTTSSSAVNTGNMAGQVDEASLEHILASDLYPKKSMTSDDKNLQVPYPPLPGESVLYLGRTSEGVVALSNFRLFIRYKDSFINLPIGVIETVECRDIFYLHVYCKDARTFRFWSSNVMMRLSRMR